MKLEAQLGVKEVHSIGYDWFDFKIKMYSGAREMFLSTL